MGDSRRLAPADAKAKDRTVLVYNWQGERFARFLERTIAPNVPAFVEQAAKSWPLGGPILRVRLYLVEGQNGLGDLRPIFRGRSATSAATCGPARASTGSKTWLEAGERFRATIVCVDTLEHVFEVRRAVEEMLAVLAPGGMILLAAPLDFYVHDYPSDYWRLTPSCMTRLLSGLEGMIIGWQGVENYPHTVFGIGCKGPLNPGLRRRQRAFYRRHAGLARRSRGRLHSRRRKLKRLD